MNDGKINKKQLTSRREKGETMKQKDIYRGIKITVEYKDGARSKEILGTVKPMEILKKFNDENYNYDEGSLFTEMGITEEVGKIVDDYITDLKWAYEQSKGIENHNLTDEEVKKGIDRIKLNKQNNRS